MKRSWLSDSNDVRQRMIHEETVEWSGLEKGCFACMHDEIYLISPISRIFKMLFLDDKTLKLNKI